ncbi:hypothetical protein QI349_02655 [Staphylococcus saprophyticus]|nr:hypothetical protein [Staphylococcus saprophyticus]
MNNKEKRELRAYIASKRNESSSMKNRVFSDGKGYALLNKKRGVKVKKGPSENARPMTKKEKEQIKS